MAMITDQRLKEMEEEMNRYNSFYSISLNCVNRTYYDHQTCQEKYMYLTVTITSTSQQVPKIHPTGNLHTYQHENIEGYTPTQSNVLNGCHESV